MNNIVGVIYEAETAYLSRAPSDLVGSMLLVFLVFCFCVLFSFRPVSCVSNVVSLEYPFLILSKTIPLIPSNFRTFYPITSRELFC